MLAGLGVDSVRAATPATPVAGTSGLCLTRFDATVTSGPDAGTELFGTLALEVKPDGRIDRGALVGRDKSRPKVVGEAHGRAITPLITVGDGRTVYGVGTPEHPIEECNGVLVGQIGGPLVGPQPGDGGDWGGGCANDDSCDPSTMKVCKPSKCPPPGGRDPSCMSHCDPSHLFDGVECIDFCPQ